MLSAEQACDLRYAAFISYSHQDAAYARCLHSQLENYRLPHRLRKIGTKQNNSSRLKPIFRDRDELTAAPDLSGALQDALADADYLIVICTGNSAKSEWVGREIEFFRRVHGDNSILAALYEGDPREALHSTLKFASNGGPPLDPLAADFRRDGDGEKLALLKLIAVIADVRLDELVQRDAQRRVRRLTLTGVSASVAFAAMVITAILMLNMRSAAERQLARMEALIGDLQKEEKEEERFGNLESREAVNKEVSKFFEGEDYKTLPDSEIALLAVNLQQSGQVAEQRGYLGEALEKFEKAKKLTAILLNKFPDDGKRIFDHAQNVYWVSEVNWRLGNNGNAEKGFEYYARLADRLVALNPDNLDWQMEKAYAASNLGSFVMRSSFDLARAEPLFRTALAIFQHVAQSDPKNLDIPYQIGDAYGWVADAERWRGDYAAALKDRLAARRILDALIERDGRNALTRTDWIANQLALARIYAGEQDFANAIRELERGRADALKQAEDDPDNMDFARELRAFDLFQVRIWLSMPASSRPTDDAISAAVEDCEPERTRLHNDELAILCTIMNARRLKQAGKAAEAEHALIKVDTGELTRGDRLSPLWGVDFLEEIRQTREIDPRGR